MKPSYEYQVQPWKYFKLASKESDQTDDSQQQTKKNFKDVAKYIIFVHLFDFNIIFMC